MQQGSHIDKGGEWETRRISIIGVAKSFISQLSVGQDLTKISLPAVFQYPYSALELGGSRSLSFCHLLFEANPEKEPFNRFINVIRWYLSATQKEKFEKKPYNPILGEWHLCWTESDQWGRTTYLAEQVSHHPPVCSFGMHNEAQKIRCQGNLCADITFHGNSVTVATKGPMKLHLGEHNEEYLFTCMLPSVGVKNVILGTKRIAWEGEIVISCKESGYKVVMFFKEEGWYCTNVVNGVITKLDKPEEPLYTFYGALGTKIMLTDCKTNAQSVLFDYELEKKLVLQYPPTHILDERSSIKLWTHVNQAIVDDDMDRADMAKREIEEAQRKRRKEGDNFPVRFFEKNEEMWECLFEEMQKHVDTIFEQIQNSSITESVQNLSIGDTSTEDGEKRE